MSRHRPRPLPIREAGPTWEHAFDAIVANGSLEHFVQVADAAAGRADEIYEEMFAICRRLLVDGGRFVTTAIHFREVGQFDPAEIARGASCPSARQRRISIRDARRSGSAAGIPSRGNSSAVRPHFELIAEEDGTHDYHLTSEYWLRTIQAVAGVRSAGVVGGGAAIVGAAAGGMGDAAVAVVGPIVGVAIPAAGADATAAADVGGEIVVPLSVVRCP